MLTGHHMALQMCLALVRFITLSAPEHGSIRGLLKDDIGRMRNGSGDARW